MSITFEWAPLAPAIYASCIVPGGKLPAGASLLLIRAVCAVRCGLSDRASALRCALRAAAWRGFCLRWRRRWNCRRRGGEDEGQGGGGTGCNMRPPPVRSNCSCRQENFKKKSWGSRSTKFGAARLRSHLSCMQRDAYRWWRRAWVG